MSDVSKLLQRIDDTIAAAKERVRQQQQSLLKDHPERQERLRRFELARDQVRAIAAPRLQALAQRFGDQVQVTPKVTESRAAATFDFKSPEAFITLTFSVIPDQEVQNLVVEYDLEVCPVLTMYESHSEFRSPIGNLNTVALEAWLDEWIIKFVDFYIRLHESEVFGRSSYVEDPIAKIRFPKFAAGATLEYAGKTWYFIDERNKDEFTRKQSIMTS